MTSVKKIISRSLINIPGWHTRRKIVVIESDDWGSIRMPSKEVYNTLKKSGQQLEYDPYSMFDNLATPTDLEALFGVLSSVKDKNGHSAVITADTVVANPDFEKIKSSNYTEYHYESFTETLKRSKAHENAFELWEQGMEAGIFHPQFHGREHVNVRKWLTDLQNNHAHVRLWFDQGSYGSSYLVDKQQSGHYMTAFDSVHPDDISFYNQSIIEGLDLFEQIFGFRSESFIATTYCWPLAIESTLKDNGVHFLQGMVVQTIPSDRGEHFKLKRTNFQGTKSSSGLIYLMRNAYFEPSQNPGFEYVNDCLNRIETAFRCYKPATISMHRLNVIGNSNPDNRTRNLAMLKRLLQEITKRWPDVEFMSSDELGRLILNK